MVRRSCARALVNAGCGQRGLVTLVTRGAVLVTHRRCGSTTNTVVGSWMGSYDLGTGTGFVLDGVLLYQIYLLNLSRHYLILNSGGFHVSFNLNL